MGEAADQQIEVCITEEFGVPYDTQRLTILVQNTFRTLSSRDAYVHLLISNDETIREVNNDFLQHDYPTDVISFDLSDDFEEDAKSVRCLDIMVSAETARREAEKRGHTVDAELALYVLHGLLHQLGFDDQTPEESKKMHEMENEILNEHDFGSVFGNVPSD